VSLVRWYPVDLRCLIVPSWSCWSLYHHLFYLNTKRVMLDLKKKIHTLDSLIKKFPHCFLLQNGKLWISLFTLSFDQVLFFLCLLQFLKFCINLFFYVALRHLVLDIILIGKCCVNIKHTQVGFISTLFLPNFFHYYFLA
jgi:hypothetical protein